MMLVYDLDSPNDERNKYCVFLEAIGWDIFIQGVVQPILSIIVAAFICPLISAAILIGKKKIVSLRDMEIQIYIYF